MSAPQTQSRWQLLLALLACAPLALLLLYPSVGDWTVFLGRFHPVVLHLPIGILFLTTLLEMLHFLSRSRLHFSTQLPLFLGATSAVAAMSLGILLMSGEGMQGGLVESHLRWGIATASTAVFALLLRSWPSFHAKKRIRFLYRASLLACCAIMVWASHQGASITHGETYLTDHLPWRSHEMSPEDQKMAKALALPIEERNAYQDLIVPLFDSKCYECHKSRSFKGHLKMDTYAGLIEGGETGPAIVPGDVDKSLTLTRIHLPIADEERMPPSNKPQLTTEEINLITWWIEQGAPADLAITDLAVDAEIASAIDSVSKNLIADLRAGREEESHELSTEEVAALRAPLKQAMAALDLRYPDLIRYQNSQSDTISAASFNQKWTDAEIAALQPIAPKIKELIIPKSELSAASAETINQMATLENLDLRNSMADDAFIQALQLPALRRLNLFQAPVGSASVPALSRLQNLKTLYLTQSNMNTEDIAELRKLLPETEIIFEAPDS